jgi:hypothetical protein
MREGPMSCAKATALKIKGAIKPRTEHARPE